MPTYIVDAGAILVPDKLQREIQACKLCRTARLCMTYCCPKHYQKIKDYVARVERTGGYILLKGEVK